MREFWCRGGSSFGKKVNELSAKSEQVLFRSLVVLNWALFKSNWVKRFFCFVTLITVFIALVTAQPVRSHP